MAALQTALVTLVVAWSGACESVPDIRFVDDVSATDGGPDDGAVVPADTGPAPTCVAPGPAGATCCNGTTWCVGQCDVAGCDECARKACTGGFVCCAKAGTALCKDKCP